MLRKLYDRTLALSAHRHAGWGWLLPRLSVAVFHPAGFNAHPMVLAERKAWAYAAVCTLASVAGTARLSIGYALYSLGRPVIEFYNGAAAFNRLPNLRYLGRLDCAGCSNTFCSGATIASVAGFALLPFVMASLAGRGLRFFAVAALIYYFGPQIRTIDKYFNLLSLAFVGLLFWVLFYWARAHRKAVYERHHMTR